MGINEKSDQTEHDNACSCGDVPEEEDTEELSLDFMCPSCGATTQTDFQELSTADTQMLNIKEMARMAQEGVDPTAVSGEWVTTLDVNAEREKED